MSENHVSYKRVYMSYPPHSGYHYPEKHFKHERPAQVLIRSLILSSSTQRKQFRMIVVRETRNTFCFPFLLTCSICSCQTVSPHIFGTESKLRLYTKKVQLRPPKNIVCWLSMVVSIDFCKRGQGLADRLGSCWTSNIILSIWFLPHKEHQPTPLYSATHSRYCKKGKNEGVHCFSGPPCCLRQYSKRETLVTLAKNHNIWEISSKPCTQDASTFSLMATEEVAPNRGLKLGCPLSPFLYFLYNNDK